jgi:hypothetical protein
MTTPATSPDRQHEVDPLAHPNVRRLLLSESTSRYLSESGEQCFQILAKGSWPACPGRWVILIAPVLMAVAVAASNVILGTHKAVRIKPPVPPPPADAEGRAAYRRPSDGATIRDSHERRRANELRDLEAIDAPTNQWLVAHGVGTQVDRWNITADEP